MGRGLTRSGGGKDSPGQTGGKQIVGETVAERKGRVHVTGRWMAGKWDGNVGQSLGGGGTKEVQGVGRDSRASGRLRPSLKKRSRPTSRKGSGERNRRGGSKPFQKEGCWQNGGNSRGEKQKIGKNTTLGKSQGRRGK